MRSLILGEDDYGQVARVRFMVRGSFVRLRADSVHGLRAARFIIHDLSLMTEESINLEL